MKKSHLRNEGQRIVYYVNGREYKISKLLESAIREYGMKKFDAGIRHQKQEVFRVLGINDDPDSWI